MSNKMHPTTKLGKVKLKISNLQRSLAFYQEVIGLQILKLEKKSALLTADGAQALVELQELDDPLVTPRRRVCGLYHYAILVPTRKDLGLVLRRLVEKGIHVGHSDHLVSEALYIADPDHNGIEIYRDRPNDEWQFDMSGKIIMGGEPLDYQGVLREADGLEWNGLPSGTTMGHVHFHVGDLAKAEQFYCGILGFEIAAPVPKEFGAIFVSAGGYHHHIGLNIWAGQGAPAALENNTGLEYYTIILPNKEEVQKVLHRLREAGVFIEEHDEAAFVKDPFGIKLKLLSL